MEVIKTDIEGVVILEPRIFKDARGYFFESFSAREFEEKVSRTTFVQDNESYSSYGVVRGLHFQKPPFLRISLLIEYVRLEERCNYYDHYNYNGKVEPRHRRGNRLVFEVHLADVLHDRVGFGRKRVDNRVYRVNEYHRADHRKCDLPEGLPCRCTVYRAGLVYSRRN